LVKKPLYLAAFFQKKIMNALTKILLASLFSFSVAITFAANLTKTIELEATYAPYVTLLGSVVGASKYFSIEDIKPLSGGKPRVTLGLLGLESNVSGSCTLDFSTQNNFKLRHIVSNQRLTRYILKYKGQKIKKNAPTIVLPSCNVSLKPLKFTRRGPFKNNPQAGIYRDIVTITVTTQ
jgi:hypothetical protein